MFAKLKALKGRAVYGSGKWPSGACAWRNYRSRATRKPNVAYCARNRSRSPSQLRRAVTYINHRRYLAARARIIAEQLNEPYAKRVMLRFAEGYERLAEQAEERFIAS